MGWEKSPKIDKHISPRDKARRTCGNCLIFCIKNYELQSEFNLAGTNREEARTEQRAFSERKTFEVLSIKTIYGYFIGANEVLSSLETD